MFGKIVNYLKEANKVLIQFEEQKVTVEVLTPAIINFFAPIMREQRASKAVEGLKAQECSFSVEKDAEKIAIHTDKLAVHIFDDFKVDIYDSKGNVLCQDYRGEADPFIRRGAEQLEVAAAEGHKVEADQRKCKIEVLKKMEEDMYFYGLGDKTGHLNKKVITIKCGILMIQVLMWKAMRLYINLFHS